MKIYREKNYLLPEIKRLLATKKYIEHMNLSLIYGRLSHTSTSSTDESVGFKVDMMKNCCSFIVQLDFSVPKQYFL